MVSNNKEIKNGRWDRRIVQGKGPLFPRRHDRRPQPNAHFHIRTTGSMTLARPYLGEFGEVWRVPRPVLMARRELCHLALVEVQQRGETLDAKALAEGRALRNVDLGDVDAAAFRQKRRSLLPRWRQRLAVATLRRHTNIHIDTKR